MHHRICCPARHLDGKLEVGTGAAISTTEHTENTEQCCFSLCTLCSLWFFLQEDNSKSLKTVFLPLFVFMLAASGTRLRRTKLY
jgi:hypothetical protein